MNIDKIMLIYIIKNFNTILIIKIIYNKIKLILNYYLFHLN